MRQNIGLFSRVLLWQKFAILGVLGLILVAIPFSFYYISTQQSINNAGLESQGVKPSIALLNVMVLTQQHRGLSNIVLSSVSPGANSTAITKRAGVEKELTKAISDMGIIIKQHVRDDAILKDWSVASQNWTTLQKQLANMELDKIASFKKHTVLIEDYLNILDKTADYFKLSLDPTAENYFLIRSVIYAIPHLTEAMGKARGAGSGMLAQKEISIEEKIKLATFIADANTWQKEMVVQMSKAFALQSSIKNKLEPLVKKASTHFDESIALTQRELLAAPVITFTPATYFDTYTVAIEAEFELNKQALVLLDKTLADNANALTQKQLLLSSIVLALLIVGIAVGYFISRSIARPIGHLVDVMNRIAAGDSTLRANLETFDEIGMLGMQFDMMIDQREAANMGVQRENETLNASIINLLQAVAKLAQKDLTMKVPVSEDVTGLIADALNLLADETAKVLSRVVQLSGDVSLISLQVKDQSDKVIAVAMEEKSEIEQSNIELADASEAMLGVAKLAVSCNEAAERAIKNTDKAQETVLDTVQGITAIRDTIRETEKRIKRLGERSQEIGGVVNLINNIAERTHILALNASMHAASAGEAGRGFAVVANEVQRLAENSREATSKIAALVNNIQVETADTVITMNEAIGQVVKGTDLAQQAGNEMRENRETTAELVSLVQRIATDSTNQVKTTQRLRERAQQIQKSTEQTYQNLQEQGEQTEHLVELSSKLVESVSVFTLPK